MNEKTREQKTNRTEVQMSADCGPLLLMLMQPEVPAVRLMSLQPHLPLCVCTM